MADAPDTTVPFSEKPITGAALAAADADPLPTGSTSDLPPGLTPGGDRKLQGQLRSAYVEKQAADESAIDNRLLKQDRDRIQQQYDATAVQPGEFPKWNSDEQATKYRTDPLSAFGSLGSVAGMIASAFTHHPMQNAMEASVAAMNAIHAGDQKAYDQAHEAWKQNLDLAIKRHEIEQQRFGDAMKLMDTDIHLGEAQLRNNAVRFGNKQDIAMLDAGMLPQLVETKAKMADTYLKLQGLRDDMEQHGISGAMAERMEKEINEKWPPGTQENVGAMYQVALIRNKLNSKDLSAQEYGDWASKFFFKEHRFPTGDEINDHTAELARAKRGGTTGDQQRSDAINAERERLIRDEDVDPNVAQGMAVNKFPPTHGATGAGASGTRPGSINDDRVKMDAAIRAEPGGKDLTENQVITERNRRLKESNTSVTGNEKEKLQSRIDKFHHSDQIIDKTLHVLETYPAAAGIAGKAMRLEERVSNIMGSKNTDRVQMMRDIELLRGWAKELLFSSNSKLKKEAERVDAIVGGTSAGDTGPNTVRALKDLKKLYDQMRAEDESKLGGSWKPPSDKPAAAPPPSKNAPWAADPIVK